MSNKITVGKIYIGERELESISPEERDELAQKIVNRIGERLNDYFAQNPKTYTTL